MLTLRLRHRKKNPSLYVNGKWTEDELLELVEIRKTQRLPYRDIVKDTNISLSTLFVK